MAFSDMIATVDATILTVFGDNLQVTIHFKDGSPDIIIPAITKNPALEADYVPGSPQGTGTLLLFARYLSVYGVLHGCTATVAGIDYDVQDAPPDMAGGLTLRLRQRKQRWDQ